MSKKVLVAMSGGVDSSVAAYLLKKNGFEVAGITMELYGASESVRNSKHVCKYLKIKHRVFNLKKEFERKVIRNFINEYISGRTPNPCVVCNETIKFGLLFKKAKQLGYDYLATGHYVDVEYKNKGIYKGNYLLKKGKDIKKDQSYFLYRLGQDKLKSVMFPLSGLTKAEVKKIARTNKIPVIQTGESQEICFVKDDYPSFISSYLKKIPENQKPGLIMHNNGKVLGRHKGLMHYTVGQRSGLGVSYREPLYVLKLDTKKNVLVAGEKDKAFSKELELEKVYWSLSKNHKLPFIFDVKLRGRHTPSPARVSFSEGKYRAAFSKEQFAVTPGQSAVFYKGKNLIGGGVIV